MHLFTSARNDATGRRLMLEAGWYGFTARLFWREVKAWAQWRLAMALPRSVALLAFVRVYAASTDAPGPEFSRVYDAWERPSA